MSTPRKATPSDWAWLEGNSTVDRCDAAWSRGLIEHRARLEALEANSKPTPNSSQIRSSGQGSDHIGEVNKMVGGFLLLERVGGAILAEYEKNAGSEAEARAAIHAVATWLEHQQEVPIGSASASADYFADMLREEASR